MIEYIGLLAGLALLIIMALKGVNILIATLFCSAVVAVTNGLNIPQAFLEFFPFGPLGAFNFAGKFFVLFICGAIFGRVMAASQAAYSISQAIIRAIGTAHTLWIVMLVCALLTYGGVVVFIVIFTMYPLSVSLMREANVPKRLVCGAIALGAGTFTMTALPGSPSIQNVIASSALGTDLFAGAWIGILASAVMIALGMFYLEHQWKLARLSGEGYEANEQDLRMEKLADVKGSIPHWTLAMIPMAVVLAVILLPRLLQLAGGTVILENVVVFSQKQPILWPAVALIIATIFSIILFKNLRKNILDLLGKGAEDAVMPLMNTAAVIGFGGVVTQTDAFAQFSQWILNLSLPPLLSVSAAVSVLSGIVGSASGGLQIFLKTLAPAYLEAGMSPEVLHRIANIASGGLDSLPHSGAVIAILMIMGLTHKQGYKDIFVLTVLVPIAALLACIGVLEAAQLFS